MTTTEHRDRRNAASPVRVFSVSDDALVWRDDQGGIAGQIPIADIRQVRLAFEMAGRDNQIVCRVTDAAGEEMRLDHRSPWVKGNHEDGYLTGVDNIIDIFEELLAAA